ncbi:MAG: hypothetical protein V7K14_06460 [Nostoc sp.]|uniref:competence protein CoiA family protein n=1 Tax=Nostoc sp. TaxID=1180 RepID=UPI002FFAD2AF
MEFAKSIKFGGEIVHADECNFYSYNDLKLCCPVCSEPVFLKKGTTRKSHFAHFPGTDTKQVEECELRVSSYGDNKQISSFIQDRGQRLEIFKQHFISLISVEKQKIIHDKNFNNWINSAEVKTSKIIIKNVIINCAKYFIENKNVIKKYYVPLIEINNNKTLLQQRIALEAIDYLCVKSSLQLLAYILYYSIYKLYVHEQNKLFKQEFTTRFIDKVCKYAGKVIILNDWLKAFDLTKNIYGGTDNAKTKSSTDIKLSPSVQQMIETSLFSKILIVESYPFAVELQVNQDGNIILHAFLQSGKQPIQHIARITGIHDQTYDNQNVKMFEWDYNDSFSKRDPELDKQIKIHLIRCNNEVIKFIKNNKYFELSEETGEIIKISKSQVKSRRRKKRKASYLLTAKVDTLQDSHKLC